MPFRPVSSSVSSTGSLARAAAGSLCAILAASAMVALPLAAHAQGRGYGSGAFGRHDQSWQVCADEDGFCAFNGRREVRFGADGRYASRVASGGIPCHVSQFGDPAPGERKHCLVGPVGGSYTPAYPPVQAPTYPPAYPVPPVASGWPTQGGNWQYCAEEDGLCRAPSGATVRFGTDGRYAYANGVNGSIACSTRVFGDPAKGQRKACEFMVGNGGYPGGGYGYGNGNRYPDSYGEQDNWTYCADEDGYCRVPFPTSVRFGSNGSWAVMRNVSGGVRCHVSTFGDPAGGQRKTCEYQR